MRIAFVSPRYGTMIHGGAETGMRMLAINLAAAGHNVEVHSTTAESMATWADVMPAGSTVEDGVTVHRHRTATQRHRRFNRLSAKVLSDPTNVDPELEARWMKSQGPHSPELLEAIAGVDSDVIAMSPYLYEPTIVGARRARVPVIIHPAAHDEAPLRLPSVGSVLAAADGIGFYTEAERRLTERVIPATRSVPQMLVGLGVDSGQPDLAQREHNVSAARSALRIGEEPFYLSLGRVDKGKGTHDLIEMFGQLHRSGRSPGRLVVAGPIVDPPPPAPGVLITGPVEENLKHGLLSGATALINPSAMESFSLVLMESWMADTPVIVTSACAATVEHVRRSGGGLVYADVDQLGRAVELLSSQPELNASLASKGRVYVDDWYTWPAILSRYLPFLTQVIAHSPRARRACTTA